MEQRAARRLREARALASTHLERHRLAVARKLAVGLGQAAAQLGATRQRVKHLNRLGHVVQIRVALGRAQTGLGRRHLCLLR